MARCLRKSVYGRSSKHSLSAALSSLVPERASHAPISLRLSAAWGAWGLSGGIYTPFFGAWLAYQGLSPTEIGTLLSAGMLLRVLGVIIEALLFSISLPLFRSLGVTRLLMLGALGCVVRWTILAF